MKNSSLARKSQLAFSLLAFLLFFWLGTLVFGSQEAYPLISESDFYCSFFILNEDILQIRIIAAERQEEKILLSDADSFYVDKGKSDGLEEGQLFSILEVGPKIKSPVNSKDYGLLGFRRGKARIVRLEENRAVAKVEKGCGQVLVGGYLIPFQEKESLLGKDLGFDVSPEEGEGVRGNIIYLDGGYNMVGPGHWALIDIGQENDLKVGQQMTIFRRLSKDVPRTAIGNLIIIDIQQQTSTVKILSCKEAVKVGDEIQVK